MTNGNNRESELEIIRQLLIATASRTESNSASIGRHQERMDHLTGGIDQLAITQQNTQANFDQLAIAQQNTQANFDQLAALTVRFIENAEADRAVIREIQSEVRGLQTENRHIWEYLMLQDENGNGDQPQP